MSVMEVSTIVSEPAITVMVWSAAISAAMSTGGNAEPLMTISPKKATGVVVAVDVAVVVAGVGLDDGAEVGVEVGETVQCTVQ